MATDYGVRQGLLGKGYSNDDIGYDQNSGYVTLKGQNFLKPEMNVQGTTYTSQQNFDNAYNQFNKQQRANQLQSATDSYITRATQPPAANPYNDQYTKMISDIMARVNAPQQDVYSSPQYAAAQAQAGRSAHQGIRAAQEALGSSGFGRSTTLGQAASQAQNEANEYLQLQLVPQIQEQLAAQKQSEINNMYNLLAPVYNQVQRQDTLDNTQYNRIRDVIDYLDTQKANDEKKEVEEKAARIKYAENLRSEFGVPVRVTNEYGLMDEQVQNMPSIKAQTEQRQYLNDLITSSDKLGYVLPELAQLIGVEPYSNTLSAQKEINDFAYRSGMLGVSQQNANTASASQRTSADRLAFDREKEANEGGKASDYYKELDSSIFIQPEVSTDEWGDTVKTGKTVVADPEGMMQYIESLGLDDAEKIKLYRRYKLDTSGFGQGGQEVLSDEDISQYLNQG